MRIDKYLWAVRYYKTRNQASIACRKGQITCNDIKVKASREVYIGDKIIIRKNQINYQIEVIAIPKSRVGAKIVNIYRMDLTPEEAFNTQEWDSLTHFDDREKGTGRPTKKDRRELDDFFENQD